MTANARPGPGTAHPRKARLAAFLAAVWDKGHADAVADYLAPLYTIHHDPGDPWDGKTLAGR